MLGVASKLGPYEILAPLGAGGMGEVYRARDTRLDRDVAIKVLPEKLANDAKALARFNREAKLLASLSHPNVASIFGVEKEGNAPFLVLEFIPGATLADRLRQGPLQLKEALAIGHQIAGALEAAHDQGIIHRDLKPANVMITPNGTAKVLDFGLAKGTSVPTADEGATASLELTGENVILGTPAYLSPEQARGQPLDRRTDVWSFGCVLFEMLTAQRPFFGPTHSDLLVAILSREPNWQALPVNLPLRLRNLLELCLRKEADRRLPSVDLAGTELADLAQSANLPLDVLRATDIATTASSVTESNLTMSEETEQLGPKMEELADRTFLLRLWRLHKMQTGMLWLELIAGTILGAIIGSQFTFLIGVALSLGMEAFLPIWLFTTILVAIPCYKWFVRKHLRAMARRAATLASEYPQEVSSLGGYHVLQDRDKLSALVDQLNRHWHGSRFR